MKRIKNTLCLFTFIALTACGKGDDQSKISVENNDELGVSSETDAAQSTSDNSASSTNLNPAQNAIPAQDQNTDPMQDLGPDQAQNQNPGSIQNQSPDPVQDQNPEPSQEQNPEPSQELNPVSEQDPNSTQGSIAVHFQEPGFDPFRDNVNPNFDQDEFELDMTEGESITVDFSVTDPNGSVPFFELRGRSAELGATIIDNGDGTGQFRWQSQPRQLGNFDFFVRAVDADVANALDNYSPGQGISGASLFIRIHVKSQCDNPIDSSVLTITCLDNNTGVRVFTPQIGIPTNSVPLRTAGDFNGDGIVDYLMTLDTFNFDFDTSPVPLANIVLGTVNGWNADFDLTELGSSQAVSLFSSQAIPESIEHIGDINQDGYSDIALAYRANIRIIFGRSTVPVNGLNTDQESADIGLNIGKERTASAVTKISPVGDFNGDGIDDFAIGYEGYYDILETTHSPTERNNGAVFILYGRKQFPSELEYELLEPSDAFSIIGATKDSELGETIQSAGDIDGDGLNDFFVTDSNAGAAYIIYGQTEPSGESLVLGEVDQPNTTNIVSMDREIIAQGTEFEADLGYPGNGRVRLLGSGDFNADGFSDFTLSNLELVSAGKLLVVLGTNDRFPLTLDVRNRNNFFGFEINHKEGRGDSGVAITPVDLNTDLNGDEIDDLLMVSTSVVYENDDSASAYILYGTSEIQNRQYGDVGTEIGRIVYSDNQRWTEEIDARSVGDINKDGVDDFIFRSSEHSETESRSYIIFGTRD